MRCLTHAHTRCRDGEPYTVKALPIDSVRCLDKLYRNQGFRIADLPLGVLGVQTIHAFGTASFQILVLNHTPDDGIYAHRQILVR